MMPRNIDWTDELEAAADAAWDGIVLDEQQESGSEQQETEEFAR